MNNLKKMFSALFSILILACTIPNEVSFSQLEFSKDGIFLYKGQPYTGEVIPDETGVFRETGVLVEGRQEGKWKVVNNDRGDIHISNYLKGKKNGVDFTLNSNKDTVKYNEYANNERNGLSKIYKRSIHDDNIYYVSEKGNYINGLREGVWVEHLPEATITKTYKKGRLNGEYTESDFDLELVGNYVNDRKEGLWISKGIDSDAIYSIEKYRDNLLDEVIKISDSNDLAYFENINDIDELRIKRTYYYDSDFYLCKKQKAKYYRKIIINSSNVPVGEVKDYYINGGLRWQGQLSYFSRINIKKDRKEGKCIWYFKNGIKWVESNYKNGQEDGIVTIYNEKGKVIKQYKEEYVEYHYKKTNKKYLSDGSKCKWCLQGYYFQGNCDICGSVSRQKLREHKAKIPKCKLCLGTGWEKGRNSYNRRLCPMCLGRGYRTY